MSLNYLLNLEEEIREREVLLEKLSNDLWLYNMQKATLDDKKREYEFLKRNYREENHVN